MSLANIPSPNLTNIPIDQISDVTAYLGLTITNLDRYIQRKLYGSIFDIIVSSIKMTTWNDNAILFMLRS